MIDPIKDELMKSFPSLNTWLCLTIALLSNNLPDRCVWSAECILLSANVLASSLIIMSSHRHFHTHMETTKLWAIWKLFTKIVNKSMYQITIANVGNDECSRAWKSHYQRKKRKITHFPWPPAISILLYCKQLHICF